VTGDEPTVPADGQQADSFLFDEREQLGGDIALAERDVRDTATLLRRAARQGAADQLIRLARILVMERVRILGTGGQALVPGVLVGHMGDVHVEIEQVGQAHGERQRFLGCRFAADGDEHALPRQPLASRVQRLTQKRAVSIRISTPASRRSSTSRVASPYRQRP